MRRIVLLAPLLLGCPLALSDFTVAVESDGDPPDVADVADEAAPEAGCDACAPWTAVAAAPGGAREKAAACALGDGRVFVWGGDDGAGNALASGAIYDPSNDTWTPIATTNAPSARVLASAVCAGTKAIVWGGGDPASTADYKDGALYDAQSDTWSAIPNPPGALPAARASYAELVGSVAVLWCGVLKNGAPANGAGSFFDPSASQWTGLGGGGPQALVGPAVAATPSQYVVFGGQSGPNDGNDLFTLQGTTWSKSAIPGAPSARHGAFAAFDGATLVAWGGVTITGPLASGGALAWPNGPWKATSSVSPPTRRFEVAARAGWAFAIASGKTAILGGVLASSALAHDGAIYDSSIDTWAPIPPWTSTDDHEWGVAVWTGKQIVVWGGRTGPALSATGERFTP